MKIALSSDLHRGFTDKTHLYHDKWAAELRAEEFDVLVLAGDLASHKPAQLPSLLAVVKEAARGRPIAVCLGNHDWWDLTRRFSPQVLRAYQLNKMREAGVHYLQDDGPLVLDGVAIVGWDGWWMGDTFDESRMPLGAAVLAASLVGPAFQRVLDQCDSRPQDWRAVVAVSHFPLTPRPAGARHNDVEFGGNPRLWPELVGRVQVFCYGHTHLADDQVIDGVRVINAGNDYDKPTYKVFEV